MFLRKVGSKINFEDYTRWRQQRGALNPNGDLSGALHAQQAANETLEPATVVLDSAPAPSSSGPGPHGDAPTPASFAEICQLIAEGKPIPGIKDIPDTVLEGQATTSNAAKRQKPWEKGTTPLVQTTPAVE